MQTLETRRSRSLIVTTVAVAGVLFAGSLAVAANPANEYTGCLYNGSLHSVAIGTSPNKPCVKPSVEIHWSQTGPQGPQGIQGIQGIQGVQGVQGVQGPAGDNGLNPVETATWDLSYVSDGVPGSIVIDSVQEIPLGDKVQGISASLTGDFSSCTDLAIIRVELAGGAPGTLLAQWVLKPGPASPLSNRAAINPLPPEVTQAGLLPSSPGLRVTAACSSMILGSLPNPSFELSFVFTWSHSPPVVIFN